jgi:hypothetical protein
MPNLSELLPPCSELGIVQRIESIGMTDRFGIGTSETTYLICT